MKILTVMTTFALLVLSVVASEPERSVLISFPDETDSSIVEQAKQEIEAAVSLQPRFMTFADTDQREG